MKREGRLLEQIAGRRDLPTYLGGWIVAIAWLSVVGTTVGDAPFNITIGVLTTLGFGVSFWLRGFEFTEQWPSIKRGLLAPSAMVRLVFMMAFVLPGLANITPFRLLVPEVARASGEWLIGTGFMWAMALYSFGLVSDGLIAFGSVLGLSMMGLMGSNNVNPEIGVAFLFFLLGNMLLLSNMTLAHHSPRGTERTTSRALGRWVGDQLIVSGIAVTLTALIGLVVSLVLQRISPPGLLNHLTLAPTRGPNVVVAQTYAQFRDRMELGGAVPALSQAPVFSHRGATRDLLWRRRVYDRYSARMWSTTPPAGIVPVAIDTFARRAWLEPNRIEAERVASRDRQTIRVTPAFDAFILAAPPLVVEVGFPEGVSQRQMGVDKYNNPELVVNGGATVELVCEVPLVDEDLLAGVVDVDPADWNAFLQVPTTARNTISQATAAVVDRSSGPYARAAAIQNFLETEFRYDANVSIPMDDYDDVMQFYLGERRGACDLIATAMALMAREAGIPARVAAGYRSGQSQAGGSYLVRQSNAHAWAELYFEGHGWLPFDPAVPGAATAEGQGGLAANTAANRRKDLGAIVSALLGLWLLAYGGLQWRRKQPTFEQDLGGEIERLYHQAYRLLRRRRLPKLPHETPRGYYERLRREVSGAAWLLPFERLTRLYERRRYRLGAIADEEIARLAGTLGEFRAQLRAYRPKRAGEPPRRRRGR